MDFEAKDSFDFDNCTILSSVVSFIESLSQTVFDALASEFSRTHMPCTNNVIF